MQLTPVRAPAITPLQGSIKPSATTLEADQLYEWSNKSLTEFFLLAGAGHTFNIQHPFDVTNEKFDKLINKTILFFNKNLT